MAGGVALNCVANGRLLREGPFEDVWIQPAAGDAGGALGAAILVWHHALDQPRRPGVEDSQKGSLLGPSFKNDDIAAFLDATGAATNIWRTKTAPGPGVARLMTQEKVTGWFQGEWSTGLAL